MKIKTPEVQPDLFNKPHSDDKAEQVTNGQESRKEKQALISVEGQMASDTAKLNEAIKLIKKGEEEQTLGEALISTKGLMSSGLADLKEALMSMEGQVANRQGERANNNGKEENLELVVDKYLENELLRLSKDNKFKASIGFLKLTLVNLAHIGAISSKDLDMDRQAAIEKIIIERLEKISEELGIKISFSEGLKHPANKVAPSETGVDKRKVRLGGIDRSLPIGDRDDKNED